MKKTLRLILGDQLNQHHSWFKDRHKNITYLMMETKQETSYVKHHIQKVIGFFLAMRSFKDELEKKGHRFIYLKLDEENNKHNFYDNLKTLIDQHGFEKFEYQLPDEYRLDRELAKLCQSISIETEAVDSEHFYTSRNELKNYFEKKKIKNWLMESFYRSMRKKHNILLEGDQPIGGKWNYDSSNRKKLPQNHNLIPPLLFERNVEEMVQLLYKMDVETIGKVDSKKFIWPISREESLALLKFFISECLPLFGDYQDAMAEKKWSIYHSRLSFAINAKILSPKEVIQQTLDYWRDHTNHIHISQIEGFIRQIIGWREYMRGIYWAKMPDYEKENQLNHKRKLPSFYWTGETKMNCMKNAIGQSIDYAYAHHIQRLMITGNFALLAGIDPNEVDRWYLGIYIDAIQWVELPNTRGMSQYADGGLVATKPYVSSANYINKMSNYCSSCHYSSTKKTGEKACPFNSLYWNFIDQHLELWSKNQRMSMMVANWNKQNKEIKREVLKQAAKYLKQIEEL